MSNEYPLRVRTARLELVAGTLELAKLEIENGRARMVTTDGHRLVKVDADSAVKTETNGLLEALIPRKTLDEFEREK